MNSCTLLSYFVSGRPLRPVAPHSPKSAKDWYFKPGRVLITKKYKNCRIQSFKDTLCKKRAAYGEATFVAGLLGTEYKLLSGHDCGPHQSFCSLHCTTEDCPGKCRFEVSPEGDVSVLEEGYSACTCSREVMTIQHFCSTLYANVHECRFAAIACWLANNPRQEETIINCGFSFGGMRDNNATTYIFLETQEHTLDAGNIWRDYCLPMSKGQKKNKGSVQPKVFFIDLSTVKINKSMTIDIVDPDLVAGYWHNLIHPEEESCNIIAVGKRGRHDSETDDPEEDQKMPAVEKRGRCDSETDNLPEDVATQEGAPTPPAMACARVNEEHRSSEESVCEVDHQTVFGTIQPVHHVVDLNTRLTCNCACSGHAKCPYCIQIHAYSRFKNTKGSRNYFPNCVRNDVRLGGGNPTCETCRVA